MYLLQALATDPSYICGVDVCIVLIVLFLNIAKSLLDCSSASGFAVVQRCTFFCQLLTTTLLQVQYLRLEVGSKSFLIFTAVKSGSLKKYLYAVIAQQTFLIYIFFLLYISC